ALREDAINLAYNALLDVDALVGAGIGLALVAPLGDAGGVEDVGYGQLQPLFQLDGDPARHPEIAVDEGVRRPPRARRAANLAPGEGQQRVAKRGHQGPEVVLRQEAGWPDLKVDHPHGRRPFDDRWLRAVATHKDIDVKAQVSEVAGDFGHVNILTARIFAAERRQWAGVLANKGNSRTCTHRELLRELEVRSRKLEVPLPTSSF